MEICRKRAQDAAQRSIGKGGNLMPRMTREDCLKVFEKHDRAALAFHIAYPKAFSENSVTYAKALLKLNEKKEDK